MGAQLALAALTAAASVQAEHAPARAFVFMALTALDSDEHPVYFAGRGRLADALGKERDAAGYRAVARVTAQLIANGLISASRPAPGHPSRIALLDGHGSALTPSDTRRSASSVSYSHDAQRHPNGRRSASEQVTLSVRTDDAQRRPEEETGVTGGEETRPTRSCTRHSTWEHTEPCRACGADRQASERWTAEEARRPKPPRPHVHKWTVGGTCAGHDGCLERREEGAA